MPSRTKAISRAAPPPNHLRSFCLVEERVDEAAAAAPVGAETGGAAWPFWKAASVSAAFWLRTKAWMSDKLRQRVTRHCRGGRDCLGAHVVNGVTQRIAGAGEDKPHVRCHAGEQTILFDFFDSRQDFFEGPGQGNAGAVGADDHGITGPPLAITGRPHAANEILARALPDEEMFESRDLLLGFKLVPVALVDLGADALHIEQRLGENEAITLQPQIFDVIVPPGMFAKSAQETLATGACSHA